jgi:hypothetical protein
VVGADELVWEVDVEVVDVCEKVAGVSVCACVGGEEIDVDDVAVEGRSLFLEEIIARIGPQFSVSSGNRNISVESRNLVLVLATFRNCPPNMGLASILSEEDFLEKFARTWRWEWRSRKIYSCGSERFVGEAGVVGEAGDGSGGVRAGEVDSPRGREGDCFGIEVDPASPDDDILSNCAP